MESIKDRIKMLAEVGGKTIATVEKELGIGNGTIGRWDTSAPASDKLQKAADYFDVSVDYLLGRKPSNEAEEMLRYIQENPKLKALISYSAKLDEEELEAVIGIVKRFYFLDDLVKKMDSNQKAAYDQVMYLSDYIRTHK